MLAGCGFHLRQPVVLPPSLQQLHVEVAGHGSLQRQLTAALEASGVQVRSLPGPGIARLLVPVAQFRTEALTVGDFAKVREYTVRYHVEFSLVDGAGRPVLSGQHIDMSREFTYDSRQTLGTATQQEQIRASLVDDMVQAILRRVQASARAADASANAAAE